MDSMTMYEELKMYKALCSVMQLRIARKVYNGELSASSATFIMGFTEEELDDLMCKVYGGDWKEVSMLNYSIDRNGD